MPNMNSELTMVVPRLSKTQATELRDSLIKVKKTYAPNAKASIQVGLHENFQAMMQRCNRQLNGKERGTNE